MFKRISLLIVFSLIAGVAFAGAAGLVPIPREEIVFLPGSHNLKDSTGELSAGTIARTSDDMLPDGSGWARGDRDQLIDTTTGQNPTSADSWWTKTNCTVDDDGGIVAAGDDDENHDIRKALTTDAANNTYIFSAKFKKGELNWTRLNSYNATDGSKNVSFDLENGVIGAVNGSPVSYGMDPIDSDGYYRCWVVWTITDAGTTYYIYPAESDSDLSYSDSTGNPLIYVKEIMLEEVPSDLTLGADITVTGITKANPGVVSATGHGMVTGAYVKFKSLTEMTELNGTYQYVTRINDNSFSINDTSGYGAAETTGGACANEVPISVWTDALGPLQNSGTLTIGTTYQIISTETDHFYAGCAVNDVFEAAAETALDANNTVKEVGAFIQPSPYVNASTIPAEGVYLDGWHHIQNTTVLNLIPYSNDISEFTVTRTTVEPDAVLLPTGDYGGNNFLKEDNTAANTHYTYYDISGLKDSTTYMASGFAKANGRTWIKVECRSKDNSTDRAHFQLSGSGAVGTVGGGVGAGEAGIDAVGSNGWYRWWMLYETATGAAQPYFRIFLAEADNDTVFDGDNTSGVYLWCLNLTEGSVLYRPIPTYGVPAYTTPETVSVALSTGLKDILDDSGTYGTTTSEGTMLIDVTVYADETVIDSQMKFVHTGSTSTPTLIYFDHTENPVKLRSYDGATPTTSLSSGGFSSGTNFIMALTWSKTNNLRNVGFSKDGAAWVWETGTYDGNFQVQDMQIGADTVFPFAWRNLRFFRRALPTDIIEANF
jgi:hypothetical protein